MRFTSSTAPALVASLLAKDVLAAVHGGHLQFHRKRTEIDYTVTDEIVETVTSTIYVTIEWPGGETIGGGLPTNALPEPAVSTTSSSAEVVVPSSNPAAIVPGPAASAMITSPDIVEPAATPSEAPASSSAPVDGGVFIQKPQSAPPSPMPVVVPTTMATVIKPSSSAAAPAVPASYAPAGSSSGSTTSSSSNKRGLAYNSAALTIPFIGSNSKVSWAYNWGSESSGLSSAFEYVPLLWNDQPEHTNSWASDANAAIASGSTHLFAFNEPDLSSQANMPVAQAAASYKTYMQPFAGKAKLGAPAVTNGGGNSGLTYLSNFLSACPDCTVDFVNIHWYDSATNFGYFKSHVQDAYTAGGNRPVWITEFAASGSEAEQNAFLEVVIPWLDQQPYVERYAYFMCSDGVLLSGSSLSQLGSTFMSYTSNTISPLIA